MWRRSFFINETENIKVGLRATLLKNSLYSFLNVITKGNIIFLTYKRGKKNDQTKEKFFNLLFSFGFLSFKLFENQI